MTSFFVIIIIIFYLQTLTGFLLHLVCLRLSSPPADYNSDCQQQMLFQCSVDQQASRGTNQWKEDQTLYILG